MRIFMSFLLSFVASLPLLSAPDKARVAEELNRVKAICDRAAEDLWDVDFCGHTLVVDGRTGEALTYDFSSRGTVSADDLSATQVPDGFPIANTTRYWRGRQWAVLVWPFQGDVAERMALILHESYHRTQGIMDFHPGYPASSPHLDDAPGRISLKLETQALAEALRAEGEAERLRHIKAALDFRAMRIDGDERAYRAERYQHLFEGLAEYTGRKLVQRPEVLESHLADRMMRLANISEFDRNYAYFTGPAWGALLDDLAPGWRAALDGKLDLADVMAEAIAYTPTAPRADEVEREGRDYGVVEIRETELARQAEVDVVRAGFRKRFVDGRVLVLTADSFTMDPRTEVSLGRDGRIFGVMQLEGRWGNLRAWDGAMMGPRPPFIYVEAIEEDGELQLSNDHWQLELNPGYAIVPHERGYAIERKS